MVKNTYLALLLSGALSCQATSRCVDPESQPSAPKIESVAFSGNGCPQGSATTGDLAENATAPVVLGAFSAEYPGASPTDRSKNCQAHIQFAEDNPEGWQLAVRNVTLAGYVILEQGSAANFYVTSYWSQDPDRTETTQQSLTNEDPLPKTEFVDVITPVHDLWSPCNTTSPGILNINVRVALVGSKNTAPASQQDGNATWINGTAAAAASSSGYAYFGRYDIPATNATYPVSERLEFQWRKCGDEAAGGDRSGAGGFGVQRRMKTVRTVRMA